MKSIIATIMLLLLGSQAQADGFYQQLVGNTPQSTTAGSSVDTDFNYSPLYLKVLTHAAQLDGIKGTQVKEFSYTPLYLRVTGLQTSKVGQIAERITSEADSKI